MGVSLFSYRCFKCVLFVPKFVRKKLCRVNHGLELIIVGLKLCWVVVSCVR